MIESIRINSTPTLTMKSVFDVAPSMTALKASVATMASSQAEASVRPGWRKRTREWEVLARGLSCGRLSRVFSQPPRGGRVFQPIFRGSEQRLIDMNVGLGLAGMNFGMATRCGSFLAKVQAQLFFAVMVREGHGGLLVPAALMKGRASMAEVFLTGVGGLGGGLLKRYQSAFD